MINYSLLGFALASALILFICGVIYTLFFESKVKPDINRHILICILFLGVLLPALTSMSKPSAINEPQSLTVGTPMIVNVQIEKAPVTFLSPYIPKILPALTYIYIAGLAVMGVITLVSIIRLFNLKKKARKTRINGYDIYLHDNAHLSSFSWFNSIFIYKDEVSRDINALLKHEASHVSHRHWIDLIIVQFILVFQWFNPSAWILRKKLQEVHEFQADAGVLATGFNERDYQELLIRNVSKVNSPLLAAGFKSCSLKKRFLMMKKNTFKKNGLLRCSTVVVAALCGIILLQMPAVADVIETKKEMEKKNIIFLNSDEAANVIYNIDNREVSYDEVKNFNSELISCVEVFNDSKKVIGIVTKDLDKESNISGHYSSRKIKESSTTEELVKDKTLLPEHAPVYEYGMDGIKDFLENFLQYRNTDIQGTVELGFTITEKGEIANIHILRSLDSELDILAVQALKALPGKWIPGRIEGANVATEMVIPLSFNI